MVAQREELSLAGVAGRVFALGRVRELGAGAEHVAMRVDRAGRQREAGLRGAVEPVEPAPGLLERPGDGPAFSRHI